MQSADFINNYIEYLGIMEKDVILRDKSFFSMTEYMEQQHITREEVLKRLQASREKKRKRIEEVEQILRSRYRNRTGEEPKYFFSL